MQIGTILNGSLNLGSLTSKAAKASSGGYADPQDTNQDRVISAAESWVYSLKHPEVAITQKLQASFRNQGSSYAQTAWTRYTAKGATSAGTSGLSGSVDLYA